MYDKINNITGDSSMLKYTFVVAIFCFILASLPLQLPVAPVHAVTTTPHPPKECEICDQGLPSESTQTPNVATGVPAPSPTNTPTPQVPSPASDPPAQSSAILLMNNLRNSLVIFGVVFGASALVLIVRRALLARSGAGTKSLSGNARSNRNE
jgi:hypothetical protein